MVRINRRMFVAGTLGAVGALGLAVATGGPAFAGAPPASTTHRIFPVADFGAAAGAAGDGAPAIRAALAAAAAWTALSGVNTASVVFASGVYRIDREAASNWYALELDGVARIGLYGDGTTLLVTTPHAGAMSIARSNTIRIEGLTIDYETPPFTQGIVTAVNAGAGTFDLQMLPGYPTLADSALFPGSGYGTVRNASTGLMKRGGRVTFSIGYSNAPLSPGVWRLTVPAEERGSMGDLVVGDGFVTGFRGNWHGVAVYRSTDVTVASVVLRAAPGAAFIVSDSDGTIIRDSTVAVATGSTRWITANADGVHHHGGAVGPRIFGNTFERLHDDGINVYSTPRAVTSVSGTTLGLASGTIHLRVGDVLQGYEPVGGTVRGTAVITAVTGDPLDGGPVSVTLDAPIPGLTGGDDVYNRTFSAPGTDIQYNTFRELRGLAVRLRVSDSLVAHNQFFDLANWGIWVGNDPSFREGPIGSTGVRVIGNSIVRPCLDRVLLGWPSAAAGIMVEHFRADYGPGASIVHSDVEISGNYVEDPPRFALFVGGARGVTVSGNTVASTASNPRTEDPTAMLGLRNVDAVAVDTLVVHEYATTSRAEVWVGPGVSAYTHA